MFSDLSKEHSDAFATEQTSSPDTQQLEISPSAIQLQNIFPVEITTKRFPVDKTVDMASAHIQLNLGEMGIDTETLQAQVQLEVHVSFPQEPRLFDIYFKLIGVFSYTQEYQPEMVQHFLQQGSLRIMIPSAQELLLSLCTRLQVPMVVLPLVQLTPLSRYLDIEAGNPPNR